MRTAVIGALLALGVTGPLWAQPNPFKLPKSSVKAHVTYELSGDQKGTSEVAMDGDRHMSRTASTIKMMGKESKANHWTLVTSDSMYTADLDKKEGTAGPNLIPLYARAYDDLDGTSKERFHSNMKEMGAMLSKAFDIGSLGSTGEKLGEETIAGESCIDHKFAMFTVCSMKKAPAISLKTSGDIVCFQFQETATSVSLGSPPASAWDRPEGITFKPLLGPQNPDSAAHAFVGYLASQQLADSLAAAKAKIEKEQADAKAQAKPTSTQEMTPEEKEQMKQACEVIKNFDMGKVLAAAWENMKKQLANEAVDAAKRSATNKLKGLIKKPRIP